MSAPMPSPGPGARRLSPRAVRASTAAFPRDAVVAPVSDAVDDAIDATYDGLVADVDPRWRRAVEVVALLALLVGAVGVGMVTGSIGWALIAGAVLTAGWALVIVDLPPRPVHTGPVRPTDGG